MEKKNNPNNINFTHSNEILNRIVTQLQNIINNISDLNNKKKIDIFSNQIKNIIKSLNNVINENKENQDKLKKYLENINNNSDKTKDNNDNNNENENKIIIKTKVYNDGKYVGEFKNNLREGRGTMYWFDGVK